MNRSYPPSGIEIESRREGGDYIIRVRGELDLACSDSFDTELKNALQSEANGRRLHVARETSPAVQRVLDVTGLGERLPFIG